MTSHLLRGLGRAVPLVLAVIFGSVLVFAVLGALSPVGDAIGTDGWIPEHPAWANVGKPFDIAPFATYFRNSFVVGVSVTILNVVTCTAAGYSFSKFDFPGRQIAFTAVLATLMVPLEILYVPLYNIVYHLGWVNSFAGLIIPAGTSAFGIFLMKQAIDSVPNELMEAARLDGAGELRTLVSVVVPGITGPMSALALFVFMTNWDSHLWPLLVASDDAHRTLPVGLAAMQANNLGSAGAPVLLMAALLAVLPTVLLFLALQKRFVEGVAMSAGIK